MLDKKGQECVSVRVYILLIVSIQVDVSIIGLIDVYYSGPTLAEINSCSTDSVNLCKLVLLNLRAFLARRVPHVVTRKKLMLVVLDACCNLPCTVARYVSCLFHRDLRDGNLRRDLRAAAES
jgi:hypothetical protein